MATAYRVPMANSMSESRQSSQSPTSPAEQLRSPWHSPVPYLFGGLAAMLGLIAFALLILACSYWKLSGYLEVDGDNNSGHRSRRDLEAGDANPNEQTKKAQIPYEEKILVIMAGQEKPTFLATPMWSNRSGYFGENKDTFCSCDEKNDKSETVDMKEERINGQDQNREIPETSNDQNR